MADTGFISADAPTGRSREPLAIVARALEAEAPYFVDYVSQELQDEIPRRAGAVDVYTTLDLHLQRIAQDALRDGIIRLDEMLARRKRQPQAALLAIDPRTGEILALVGGRSYNQSQYNRASSRAGSRARCSSRSSTSPRSSTRRRTGAPTSRRRPSSSTSRRRSSSTRRPGRPGNYEDEYDGPITLRRALALSRNIAAIKVAESAGYDQVAALWRRVGAGTPPRPYPSIALGVFEATPFEIADRLHAVPERRHDAAADARSRGSSRKGKRPAARDRAAAQASRGPTRHSSSPT